MASLRARHSPSAIIDAGSFGRCPGFRVESGGDDAASRLKPRDGSFNDMIRPHLGRHWSISAASSESLLRVDEAHARSAHRRAGTGVDAGAVRSGRCPHCRVSQSQALHRRPDLASARGFARRHPTARVPLKRPEPVLPSSRHISQDPHTVTTGHAPSAGRANATMRSLVNRATHVQQNAHRCVPPGRDPGCGAQR